MKLSIRFFLILFFLSEIAISLLVGYLSYAGNDSYEWRKIILKYFTADDIRMGEEYDRSGFATGIASSLINFGFLGIFAFSSISERLEKFYSRISRNNFVATTFLFLFSYIFSKTLINLPFKFYFGYIIEHRFGFSKMSLTDWAIFTLKGDLVGISIILPVAIGGLLLIRKFRNSWIYILPVSAFGIGMIFSVLLPDLITPIFYDQHPIPEGALKEKILKLSESAGIGVNTISVIDESRYSGHTNAYFTGWGEQKKIVLYDTMLKTNTDDEILSVLGHEIGHWKKNHVLIELVLNSFEIFLLCFLIKLFFIKAKQSGDFHLNEIFSPSTIPFILLFIGFQNFIFAPFGNFLSRKFESDADLYSLILTKNSKAAISSEIKLVRDNKSRLNPHPVDVLFHYSHPMAVDRIRMAEEFGKSLK